MLSIFCFLMVSVHGLFSAEQEKTTLLHFINKAQSYKMSVNSSFYETPLLEPCSYGKNLYRKIPGGSEAIFVTFRLEDNSRAKAVFKLNAFSSDATTKNFNDDGIDFTQIELTVSKELFDKMAANSILEKFDINFSGKRGCIGLSAFTIKAHNLWPWEYSWKTVSSNS